MQFSVGHLRRPRENIDCYTQSYTKLEKQVPPWETIDFHTQPYTKLESKSQGVLMNPLDPIGGFNTKYYT